MENGRDQRDKMPRTKAADWRLGPLGTSVYGPFLAIFVRRTCTGVVQLLPAAGPLLANSTGCFQSGGHLISFPPRLEVWRALALERLAEDASQRDEASIRTLRAQIFFGVGEVPSSLIEEGRLSRKELRIITYARGFEPIASFPFSTPPIRPFASTAPVPPVWRPPTCRKTRSVWSKQAGALGLQAAHPAASTLPGGRV